MYRRLLLLSACGLIVCGLGMRPAVACPNCRADAAGLATTPSPAESADGLPFNLSGGIDVPSAFYFRGYQQAIHGPIFQPYLNVYTTHSREDGIVVKPYVSFFNSSNWNSNNRMADMTDVMVGAVASGHGFTVDARYAWYTMNPVMRSQVHEFGAKFSFDVMSLSGEEFLQQFSLKPFIGLYRELNDEVGTEEDFINVGIEPSWRTEIRGHKLGVGLPIEWGLTSDHYYLNADGTNANLGYFSTAVTTSVALTTGARSGQWFLNTSVQYLHLAADSVRAVNGGGSDECVGKIGVSFVY
jgi:hypothetical protein